MKHVDFSRDLFCFFFNYLNINTIVALSARPVQIPQVVAINKEIGVYED